MKPRITGLLDLPTENLITEVGNELDPQSLMNFSSINKYTHSGFFQPVFLKHFKKYFERSAKKEIETLLKIYPKFMNTNDLRNFFLASLNIRDIDMCQVIATGRELIFNEIELPQKFVDETNTYDFTAIVAAIRAGKKSNLEEALAQFRTDLDKIVKEKGFPFQALRDGYAIYDQFSGRRTREQFKLFSEIFSVKVVGYIQRLSPAWLKKVLAGGFFGGPGGDPCKDSFILSYPYNQSIDPAYDIPHSGLGFDFCVGILGGKCMRLDLDNHQPIENTHLRWEKLFKDQMKELDSLQRQINPKPGWLCEIL